MEISRIVVTDNIVDHLMKNNSKPRIGSKSTSGHSLLRGFAERACTLTGSTRR